MRWSKVGKVKPFFWEKESYNTLNREQPTSGSRGPWGPGPLAPMIFSKSCSFQATLAAQILGSGPPWGQTSIGPPLTKILDPPWDTDKSMDYIGLNVKIDKKKMEKLFTKARTKAKRKAQVAVAELLWQWIQLTDSKLLMLHSPLKIWTGFVCFFLVPKKLRGAA